MRAFEKVGWQIGLSNKDIGRAALGLVGEKASRAAKWLGKHVTTHTLSTHGDHFNHPSFVPFEDEVEVLPPRYEQPTLRDEYGFPYWGEDESRKST